MTDLIESPSALAVEAPYLSFRLSDDFVAQYAERPVNWGFPCGGGNSLGELQFLSKYSALKPDGTKERWYECCRRVVEGMYSILKDHCMANRTPWNHAKAHRAAEDAYERLFTMKWTPPGRGLQHMGREFIFIHGSAALQNCAFLSTQHLGPRNPTQPFVRLMEMSMLGIGVGFDTLGSDRLQVHMPAGEPEVFVVPDSREGWCESTELVLRSYLLPGQRPVECDTSLVRPKGSPIRGLGGTAAGPGPLLMQHEMLRKFFTSRVGLWLSGTDIVDVFNIVGKGVVMGNVRSTAELALGEEDDMDFLTLKDWNVNPERMAPSTGWGHLSNNSIKATVGRDYSYLGPSIELGGEPGLIYMDLVRAYGRLIDPPDHKDRRAMGVNPCAEQSLEDQECCTLVETFPTNHTDLADYLRTTKAAYLYAKAVTLMSTHWPETNEVMQRNRRIGCSMSGIVQFVERDGWSELRNWSDAGYAEVCRRDTQYSEWLGVRESIKKTSVKPSGTVSLLAGVTPGVHFPVSSGFYLRRTRYDRDDPVVALLATAGYHVEPDVKEDTKVVVTFPVRGPDVRSEKEATVWEKVALAALLQRHWADNQVSATFTFSDDEASQIPAVLRAFDGQLKSVSFLPLTDGGAYPQMPYEHVEATAWDQAWASTRRVDTEALYSIGQEAEGEMYCTTDTCIRPEAR